MERGVVADHDQLNPLEAHHAVGLRPAPVVADRHADGRPEHVPDREVIAGLEIPPLGMLEEAPGLEFVVARDMHLPIEADRGPGPRGHRHN